MGREKWRDMHETRRSILKAALARNKRAKKKKEGIINSSITANEGKSHAQISKGLLQYELTYSDLQ